MIEREHRAARGSSVKNSSRATPALTDRFKRTSLCVRHRPDAGDSYGNRRSSSIVGGRRTARSTASSLNRGQGPVPRMSSLWSWLHPVW